MPNMLTHRRTYLGVLWNNILNNRGKQLWNIFATWYALQKNICFVLQCDFYLQAILYFTGKISQYTSIQPVLQTTINDIIPLFYNWQPFWRYYYARYCIARYCIARRAIIIICNTFLMTKQLIYFQKKMWYF
jgi:hypothetical protein